MSARPKMSQHEVAISRLAGKRKERITKVRAKNPNPIVVGKELKRASEVTIIPPSELETLRIDPAYQRPENRELVNQLLAVLEAGGMVPDPITVVVRPDKSRYIVDGQQRWAAHYLAMKPLAAVLYFVTTMDEERRLFSVLNTYRRPSPAVRMRAWTGPSSQLISWLAGNPASPIMGQLTFTGGGGKFQVTTVLRGLGAALGMAGHTGTQATEEFMRGLDRLYVANPQRAHRLAGAYLSMCKGLFSRLQVTPALALGMACADRWDGVNAFEQPSKASLYNMRRLNWATPPIQFRHKWLQTLKADVLRRWK